MTNPDDEEKVVREIWKHIPGYNKDLQVSNLGRLRRSMVVDGKLTNHIYKLQRTVTGTVGVPINNPREGIKRSFIGIATLMVKAFFDPDKDGKCLFYRDGDRTNLKLDNLVMDLPTIRRSKSLNVFNERSKSKEKYIRKYHRVSRLTGKKTSLRFAVSCVRNGKRYWFGTGHKTLQAAMKVRDKEIAALDYRLRLEAGIIKR